MTIQYAQIQDNTVTNIVIIPESEHERGQEYLSQDLGLSGEWVFNDIESGNHAFIGGLYNPILNKFSTVSPHPSWTFDWENEIWIAPISKPETGGPWIWNEELGNWEEVIIEG